MPLRGPFKLSDGRQVLIDDEAGTAEILGGERGRKPATTDVTSTAAAAAKLREAFPDSVMAARHAKVGGRLVSTGERDVVDVDSVALHLRAEALLAAAGKKIGYTADE